MSDNQKPVAKFEDYPAGIAIFERENENGKWYSADVSKTYKDGDEYKKTRNFSRNDLLKLNALVPQAINRMQELGQSETPAPAEPDQMEAIKEQAQEHVEQRAQAPQQEEGQTP